MVEDGEGFTVEPGQSVRRGSPQIPVACLQNGRHPVIGQPILMGPSPLIVLSGDVALRKHRWSGIAGEGQKPKRRSNSRREPAWSHSGCKSCIASGSYRQLVNALRLLIGRE